MRPIALMLCGLLALAGCQTEKKDDPDWHVDPTQQSKDDQQPVVSPAAGEKDVALDPQIEWHYTAYKKLHHLQLQLLVEPGDKPVLTLVDKTGALGRQGTLRLLHPPQGVLVERHDKTTGDKLQPGTWYVLSLYADGDRGTHLARVRFRTREAPAK